MSIWNRMISVMNKVCCKEDKLDMGKIDVVRIEEDKGFEPVTIQVTINDEELYHALLFADLDEATVTKPSEHDPEFTPAEHDFNEELIGFLQELKAGLSKAFSRGG